MMRCLLCFVSGVAVFRTRHAPLFNHSHNVSLLTSRSPDLCKCNHTVSIWLHQCISSKHLEQTSITSNSGDQSLNENSNLILFCNTTGKPPATVTWRRVLDDGSDGDEMFVGNPWIIKNIIRNLTGTYRCTANNGFGKAVTHSLYVNVMRKCII